MKDPDHLIVKILSGDGSPEEKRALKRWMEESPENSLYFKQLEEVWQNAEIKAELFEPDSKAALHKLDRLIYEKERIGEKESSPLYQYFKIAAAILLIAMSIGIGLYYGSDAYPSEESNLISLTSTTQLGEPVVLEDGTKVWLNANSTLSYPRQFTANRREVFLVGEAFFEVKKDPRKPFLIHAGNSVTQVLGTSFNVNAFPEKEEVIVSVTSGKVAFYPQKEEESQVLLEKGERGVYYTKSGMTEKILNHDLNFLSWKTGVLRFENTLLPEAIQKISHHFNREITLGEGLSACRLSATFDNEPIQDILDELSIILHLRINYQDNQIILQGKGC